MRALIVTWWLICVLVCVGWIMNVVHIINNFNMADISGEIIVRIIGVVLIPLGAIMGWFG